MRSNRESGAAIVASCAYDVYVASAKSDAKRVSVITRALERAGLQVALRDRYFLPGDKVVDRVDSVIGNSRTGLVIFSRAAAADPWAREEYQAFMRRSIDLNRLFIPVLIDDVKVPDLAANREPCDLSDPEAPDYDERIARLVAAIRAVEIGPVGTGMAADNPPARPAGGADTSAAEADHQLTLAEVLAVLSAAVAPAQLPPGRLQRIWRAALGPLAPDVDEQVRDCRDLVRAAADVIVAPGAPPAALTVGEHIAAASDPAVAADIRLSITRLASRHSLRLPDPAVSPPASGHSSVLVSLLPNAPGSRRYRVSVSAYLDPGRRGQPVEWDDSARPIKAIRSHVGRVVSRALRRVDDLGGTTLIEFLLPRDLLGEPVEEWHLEKKIEKMGSLYPVVVRDAEWPEFALGKSRARWENFQHPTADPDRQIKRVSCREPLTADQLRAWFELDMSRTVLVLPFQPTRSRGWDMLDAVFASGVAVVVWPRSPCNPGQNSAAGCGCESFSRDFFGRIREQRLSQLPEIVKRLRNEASLASGTVEHCGRAISLAWHDPYRVIDDAAPLSGPGYLKGS
jgi:hypothetical protein